jgi:hypothetical protein
MKRVLVLATAAPLATLLVPTSAVAAQTAGQVSGLRLGVSLVGLLVAVVLLIEALGVRKVAFGGAIAEKISYVVLAVICLAGSALAQWARNFVLDVTQEQVRLASELLVIVAMALLAAYFYSVRSALRSYLREMTGSEMLAASSSGEEEA